MSLFIDESSLKRKWTYNIEGVKNTAHKSISNVKVINSTHDMIAISSYDSSFNSFSRFIYSSNWVIADHLNTFTDRFKLEVKGIFIKDVNNLIGLFSDVNSNRIIIGSIDMSIFIF